MTQPAMLVSIGGNAILECQATGVPPPLVRWFKGMLRPETVCTEKREKGNFLRLVCSFYVFPDELEVGSAPYVEQDVHHGTLHIRGVQEVDAGQYSCVASSSAGTAAGTVSLQVGGENAFLRVRPNPVFHLKFTQRKIPSSLHSGPIVL